MIVPTSESRCYLPPPITSADISPYCCEISRTRSTILALTAEAAMPIEFAGGFRKVRRGVFLHLDCARKENIILQVNVLMQICFERSQRLIECLKADAAVGGYCVPLGYAAQLLQ